MHRRQQRWRKPDTPQGQLDHNMHVDSLDIVAWIILAPQKVRHAHVHTHRQAKAPIVGAGKGLIQTRIATQRIVYPATALLNSELSPLILQRRPMVTHCSGRNEKLGTHGGLRISLRSGGRPSGGTWRFPAAGQRACKAGKTRV